MKSIRVSLIATVFNEEKNIEEFLKSIINQTKKPNEFIIVDGGSRDKTYGVIKKYSKKYSWIKRFQRIGSNISQGRNIAIKKAKNEIIVACDAGTEYEKSWLKELVKKFINSKADVGFGKTLPLVKNKFQKILAKRMRQRFGSSRNIIFKKEVWKKVGGYPEDLKIGEDTLFNERVKGKGFKIILIPKAIGYWEMRSDLVGVKEQFYNYGYWDGISYRKYHTLPLHHKIAVVGLTGLIPFYPIGYIISKISKSFEIDFVRRFAYLKGFWKGYRKRK